MAAALGKWPTDQEEPRKAGAGRPEQSRHGGADSVLSEMAQEGPHVTDPGPSAQNTHVRETKGRGRGWRPLPLTAPPRASRTTQAPGGQGRCSTASPGQAGASRRRGFPEPLQGLWFGNVPHRVSNNSK